MGKQYRTIAIALIMTLTFCACSSESPVQSTPSDDAYTTGTQTQQINGIEGVYEGEVDSGGKRSGYGIWRYGNYEYRGNWTNDKPNGEGILYELRPKPDDAPEGAHYVVERITKGTFVDGVVEGPVEYTMYFGDNTMHTWEFESDKGYALENQKAKCTGCDADYGNDDGSAVKVGWVPPFMDAKIREVAELAFIYDMPEHIPRYNSPTYDPLPVFNDEPLEKPVLLKYEADPFSPYGAGGDGNIKENTAVEDGEIFFLYKLTLCYTNVDGSGAPTTVLEKLAFQSNVYVFKGYLYFFRANQDNNVRSIHRARLDGSDEQMLVDGKNNQNIVYMNDAHIYYCSYDDQNLRRIKLDGTGAELVWENWREKHRVILAANDKFFITDETVNIDRVTHHKIVSYDIDVKQEKVLAQDVTFREQIGEYVYYTQDINRYEESLYRYYLCRMKMDGSDQDSLHEENESLSGIYFTANSIYCAMTLYPDAAADQNHAKDGYAIRMNLDGSDRIKVLTSWNKVILADGKLIVDGHDKIGVINEIGTNVEYWEQTKGAYGICKIEDGWIYYFMRGVEVENRAVLHRIRTDGTGNMKIERKLPDDAPAS